MSTRRDVVRLFIGGLSAAMLPCSRSYAMNIGGVSVGAISYCFRSVPRPPVGDHIDALLASYRACSLDLAELTNVDLEPLPSLPGGGRVPDSVTSEYLAQREVVRAWRLSTPLSRYEEIGRKFRAAGVRLLSYVMTISDDFSDAEIEKTMLATRALGVRILGTNQTRLVMAQRALGIAKKHGVILTFHNHANTADHNEIASVQSFEQVFAMAPNARANLDIGHFVAGNNDPIAFIDQYHSRITHLHLKDRERNNGPNRPWGQGATPIAQVLRLLRDKDYAIPCLIEYEYAGAGTAIEEVEYCIGYIREALK